MPRLHPSRIEVRDGLIVVYANNTGNPHLFDFDPALFVALSGKAWREHERGYLYRWVHVRGSKPPRKFKLYAFHLVLPRRPGLDVDHISRDPRDNRRSNLRYLPHAANTFNCRLKRSNRSGVCGVYWCERDRLWYAEIMVARKKHFLGCFKTLEEAATARREAEERFRPGVIAVERVAA